MSSKEEWISVKNNKKFKIDKIHNKFNKNVKKYDKEREFDKSKVKLWYDNNSWQHNILIDNYEYEDNSSVMSKFKLDDLVELYKKAETNYDRNNIVRKLTKRLNDDKWNEISPNIRKINNNINEKEELESKIDEHVIDDLDIVLMNDPLNLEDQNVVLPSSRIVDKNISFASILKQKN